MRDSTGLGTALAATIEQSRHVPARTNAVAPPIAPLRPSTDFDDRAAIAERTCSEHRLCVVEPLDSGREIVAIQRVRRDFEGGQWSGRGSNPQPPHCERGALPIELPPHLDHPI